MKILFKKDNENIFWNLWNKYIYDNLSSLKYTKQNIEYNLAYSPHIVEDISFVIIQNNIPVAICFLPLEKIDEKLQFSFSNHFINGPLYIDNKKIERKVFETIDFLAKKYNALKIMIVIDPLVMEYKEKFNNLLRYQYLDVTAIDGLIDLRKDKAKLWSHIRKRYRYDITKMRKNHEFEMFVMDKNNPIFDIHEQYRVLHHKCAGKVTRPIKTFNLQFEMLKNNQATLFGLKKNNEFIAFTYFYHFKKTCISASLADNSECDNLPIYHIIVDNAIKYYSEKEFEFMELSQPYGYGVQMFDYMDKKQLNISFFKRGFGTKDVPLYRGIKYFNKEPFLNDMNYFITQYIKHINEQTNILIKGEI